jgi:hypothetical protein
MRREMHPIEPEELMAYLDGELAPQRASEAAQHVSQCRECQTVAAEMQSVSRRLLEWQIDEPGPRVDRAVNSARPPERTRPAWRRGVPWIVGLAAACLVLMMVVTEPRHRLHSAKTYISPDRELREMQKRKPLMALLVPASRAQLPQSQSASVVARTRDPLVIRTAQITLITPDFAKARASLENILKRHGGHIGNLAIGSPADSGQSLQATLRVPAPQLDATMAEIRNLGRVETEQQGGEEVTQQMVDLEARLANARNTEQRLANIMRRSTGKITDVLAVEKEIDRVRGEIEGMEAERKNLGDRVNFSTLDVRINEEYKAHLAVAAPSTVSRLRNAAVEGYRNVADSLTGIAMFLLSYGPALILWAALLFFPGRLAWRRLRKSGTRPVE